MTSCDVSAASYLVVSVCSCVAAASTAAGKPPPVLFVAVREGTALNAVFSDVCELDSAPSILKTSIEAVES